MEGNGGEHNLKRATDALAAAGAKPECPSCGHIHWTRDPEPVVLPILRGEDEMVPGIPAYMFACRNCGFIRLHGVNKLLGGTDASG